MSIDLSHISKSFGTYQALHDVSLSINDGELVALLGPSGSGKTTLLRIIAGLDTPNPDSRSRIRFHEEDVAHRPAAQRRVGFVFQHYALFRHMSIFENVAFGMRVLSRKVRPTKAEIERRVHELLGLVQLDGLGKRFPSQLSGGQRQRAALARALAVEPRVLLLDEPFGALDARVRQDLRAWLRRLHDEIHVTSILVTHDQEEALEVADRVVVMNRGKIEQIGTPEEVFHKPATRFVMEFLGQVNVFRGRVQGGKAMLGEVPLDGHYFPGKEQGSAMVYMRPHELDIKLYKNGAPSFPARVTRINPAGSIAKVTTRTSEGQDVLVDLSLDDYQRLSLTEGTEVHIYPKTSRVFLPEYEI
ncbi:MAG TPA: TOBE-like domain-containing protein [Lacipirellulaceae bacterium]|jgi:sulfate transport system ATP-binding protein|nr:TOBE-like domain-containing protein [Lacipirellulaceae bacterium]